MNDLPTKLAEPIPSIEFIFTDGYSHVMPILCLCRGLNKDMQRPHAFRFIDCGESVVTDEFVDWYFNMVLPSLNINPFMRQVSLITAPQNFQQLLALSEDY